MSEPVHDKHKGNRIEDFKRKFSISLALTVPILALSPHIQQTLGISDQLDFRGELIVLWALSSFVYFFGGKPFLSGFLSEIKERFK
jgi:Cu2+-exporting ATPase